MTITDAKSGIQAANAAERVKKGAEKLTAFFGGPGWVGQINMWTLDMRTPKQCVLGQLFGDYALGLAALALDAGTDAEAHGFVGNGSATSDQLVDAWLTHIDRACLPRPGDKVIVTFEADLRQGYNSWTINRSQATSVIGLGPKPKPEPGDRIKFTKTAAFGTVLKPSDAGASGSNGHVRVIWDSSKAIQEVKADDVLVMVP